MSTLKPRANHTRHIGSTISILETINLGNSTRKGQVDMVTKDLRLIIVRYSSIDTLLNRGHNRLSGLTENVQGLGLRIRSTTANGRTLLGRHTSKSDVLVTAKGGQRRHVQALYFNRLTQA